jgi:hypothetical protein
MTEQRHSSKWLDHIGKRVLVEALGVYGLKILRRSLVCRSHRDYAIERVVSPGTAKLHFHDALREQGIRSRTVIIVRFKELI